MNLHPDELSRFVRWATERIDSKALCHVQGYIGIRCGPSLMIDNKDPRNCIDCWKETVNGAV